MRGVVLMMLCAWMLIPSSCDDDIKTCEEGTVVQLGVNFYNYRLQSEGESADTVLTRLSVLGIGAADSIYRQQSVSSVDLSLNQSADSSAFILQPDGATADTVLVRYKRQLQFLSPGCGFVTFFTLDTVIATSHHIDSLAITHKSVVNTNVENIRLYY